MFAETQSPGCPVTPTPQERARVDSVAAVLEKRKSEDVSVPATLPRVKISALFVGPFALETVVAKKAVEWTHKLETAYEVEVDMHIATPPYQTDDIERKGYWLKPDGHTPEKRVKSLKSQTNGALIVFLQEVERTRPRLIIGLGQGSVVVGVGSFPVILERACRDRAVTQQQMESFRTAWFGVTSQLASH